MEESGPEPRDEEDRRTSRPTRRGHRRLKTPPKPPHARRNPAKVEELSTTATPEGRGGRRHAPDWPSSTLAEDRDAPGRGERSKSQEELPVCAPSSACLEREGEVSARSTTDESVEERQRLPRRREELTEEGDPPLERSKYDHRTQYQTTDCNARESGTCPDAAGHQTRQDQQREQQASQSQHKKWPPQQQAKTGTRYPPTLLQKRSHPPRLQVFPGKRSQTSP